MESLTYGDNDKQKRMSGKEKMAVVSFISIWKARTSRASQHNRTSFRNGISSLCVLAGIPCFTSSFASSRFFTASCGDISGYVPI